MVARWCIFTKPINTSLKTAENIVTACVVLHNYCMGKVGYCSRGFADELCNKELVPGEWRRIVQNNFGVAPLRNDGSNTQFLLCN